MRYRALVVVRPLLYSRCRQERACCKTVNVGNSIIVYVAAFLPWVWCDVGYAVNTLKTISSVVSQEPPPRLTLRSARNLGRRYGASPPYWPAASQVRPRSVTGRREQDFDGWASGSAQDRSGCEEAEKARRTAHQAKN